MRRVPSWAVVAMAIGLVVAGCTSSDPDEDDDVDDTEVAGAVLERDDEGRPASIDDPDDERVDPRETEPDDGDDATDTDGDDAAEPDEPADEPEPAPEPQPGADDPDPAPSDDAAPQTPPAPEPRALSAGTGLPGDLVGFGADGAEVLVGGPLESPPAVGARADAVRVGDADEVRCLSTLQAPQDRGLVARGDLTVTLVAETHDGDVQRIALLVMELDVELVAGERYALPQTRARSFERTVTASLSCEASFAPA